MCLRERKGREKETGRSIVRKEKDWRISSHSVYLRELISLYVSYFTKAIRQKPNVCVGTENPKNSMEKEDVIHLHSWILFLHTYYYYTGCSLFSTKYKSF